MTTWVLLGPVGFVVMESQYSEAVVVNWCRLRSHFFTYESHDLDLYQGVHPASNVYQVWHINY